LADGQPRPTRPGAPVNPAGLAEALGWPFDRLGAALAALDNHLAATGGRIDHDPAPTNPPSVRARELGTRT
jgi:hypothetical protein